MPLNLPSITVNNYSFGPGRLFLGASGATPTVDVGSIAEDGVTFEVSSSKREIRQGNPRLVEYPFQQAQDVGVKTTGIEWNVTNLAYALGAGVTTSSASQDTISFGGDPLVSTVAIDVRHQMAVTGQTLDLYVWKAYGDAGSIPVKMAQDEHQFAYSWKAIRSATDWAGNSLGSTVQLVKLLRQKT